MQKAPGMRSESTLSTEVGLKQKFRFHETKVCGNLGECLQKLKNDGCLEKLTKVISILY